MSMIGDIAQLKFKNMLLFSFILASTVCTGFILIFILKNNLMYSLDIFKLILLSISVTLPVFILNAIYTLLLSISDTNVSPEDKEYNASLYFLGGSVITLFEFNILILITYLFHQPFKNFVIYLIITQIGLAIFSFIRFGNKQPKKG